MKERELQSELINLFRQFDDTGGVLDYVLLQIEENLPAAKLHKLAAITAIKIIDDRLAEYAKAHASEEYPIDMFYRLTWDINKLNGKQVSFDRFWGSNADIDWGVIKKTGFIPNVDGYRTAFYFPPQGSPTREMFSQINNFIIGPDPSHLEIFEWSTEWSNYFDSGHEWWGAFFWTLRMPGEDWMTAIGASSTD